MADVRESFPTLEDSATGAGQPLHKVLEADASAAKNASAGLVAVRDSDNSLRYLRMSDSGALLISQATPGICKRAGTDGTPVSGSASKTQVAEISLTVAKKHKDLYWNVSNFRDTVYTIELIDDPSGSPVVIQALEIIVGPGDFNDNGRQECFEFDTTGLTSPVLRLSGKNLNTPSDFRGSITIFEQGT
jgi:hypothetical protein